MQNYWVLLTDKDGNSPLLQVVQPHTFQERETTLEKFYERVKAGTLIITKKPVEQAPPSLFAADTDNTLVEYQQVSAEWTPDTAFDLLATNRLEFVATLERLQSKDNFSEICKKIAPEIIGYFLATTPISFPIECAKAIRNYNDNSYRLTAVISEMKASFPQIREVESLSNIIESLTRAQLLQQAEIIKNTLSAKENSYQSAVNVCSSREVFFCYLQEIKTKQIPIGYLSLLIFAEQINQPVIVWRRDRDTLSLVSTQPKIGKEIKNTLNLLVDQDYTHMTLLFRPENKTTQNSNSPYQLYLEKQFNLLEEKNIYLHNALHRAVRSTAADILVPVLLNDFGFKKVINSGDKWKKTALHRAIKYYSDFQKDLIKEFTNKPIHYIDVALACFKQLIEAGADLTIKDADNQSPLDRAQTFSKSFTEKNPKFNLKSWLQETRNRMVGEASKEIPENKNSQPKKPTTRRTTKNKNQITDSTSTSKKTKTIEDNPSTIPTTLTIPTTPMTPSMDANLQVINALSPATFFFGNNSLDDIPFPEVDDSIFSVNPNLQK